MRTIVLALALIVPLLAARDAAATTSCSFQSVGAVSFGAYDVFSSLPADGTGSITFRCNGVGPGDLVTVHISKGNATSFLPRTMTAGAESMSYNLYSDASRTQIWGDGTSGTSAYGPSTPPDATDVTLTVYGRIPALQDVAAGSYADSVVISINY